MKWINSENVFLSWNLSFAVVVFYGSPIKFEDKIYTSLQEISPERNNLHAIVQLCKQLSSDKLEQSALQRNLIRSRSSKKRLLWKTDEKVFFQNVFCSSAGREAGGWILCLLACFCFVESGSEMILFITNFPGHGKVHSTIL